MAIFQEVSNWLLGSYKVRTRDDGSGNLIQYVDTTGDILGTTVGNGRKTVTTAGSRVQLATTTACKKLDICALSSNTGIIVIGGTTVVAAVGTRSGFALSASDKYLIAVDDLSKIWLDSTVNGEGVSYTYYT